MVINFEDDDEINDRNTMQLFNSTYPALMNSHQLEISRLQSRKHHCCCLCHIHPHMELACGQVCKDRGDFNILFKQNNRLNGRNE